MTAPVVPTWWEFAILALAAFRAWKLIGDDEILERPRKWLCDRMPSEKLELFLVCPWCAGFWLTLAVWALWLVWPEWTLFVATPAALNGAWAFAWHVSERDR